MEPKPDSLAIAALVVRRRWPVALIAAAATLAASAILAAGAPVVYQSEDRVVLLGSQENIVAAVESPAFARDVANRTGDSFDTTRAAMQVRVAEKVIDGRPSATLRLVFYAASPAGAERRAAAGMDVLIAWRPIFARMTYEYAYDAALREGGGNATYAASNAERAAAEHEPFLALGSASPAERLTPPVADTLGVGVLFAGGAALVGPLVAEWWTRERALARRLEEGEAP